MQTGESIILYTSEDGRSSVVLYARDGSVWLNQLPMAELFATSKQNVGHRGKLGSTQNSVKMCFNKDGTYDYYDHGAYKEELSGKYSTILINRCG